MNSRGEGIMKQSGSCLVLVSVVAMIATTRLDLEGMLVTPVQAQYGCQNEYYWIEAECGTLYPPGQVGQDNGASEGGYLTTPAGSGRYLDTVGPRIATYPFTLQYSCPQYALWARVRYNSSDYNSYWIQFDQSSNFQWRFDDQQTGYWHWEIIGFITGLTSGDHWIYLKLREEQTQVDKFLMTSDLYYVPQGPGDPANNRCSPQGGAAIPKDPDRFLTFFNAVSPSHTETAETAAAYYKAIDPLGRKTTLRDWLHENKLDVGADAEAVYVNDADLGFGRHMFIKTLPDGSVASYVKNYVDNTPTPDNVDGTAEEKIANIVFDRNLLATVCMEYGPPPSNANGRKYTKFYAFGADGARVGLVDLDGRGEKGIPGSCNVCHGFNPRPLLPSNRAYPDEGDTGSGFLPWDVDNLKFSQVFPQYALSAQQGAVKALNAAVLKTNPPAAVKELIEGWYGGPGLPSNVFNGQFVPPGWKFFEETYLGVQAPNCRGCHVMRNPAADFSTFDKYNALQNRAKHLVFDRGVMPLAKRTYDRFWRDYAASDPLSRKIFDMFGAVADDPASRESSHCLRGRGPAGHPWAGEPVTLDASASLFADTLSWSLKLAPPLSVARLYQPTSIHPTFTPDRGGTYIFELTARSALGSSTSQVSVTASSLGNSGLDFATTIVAHSE